MLTKDLSGDVQTTDEQAEPDALASLSLITACSAVAAGLLVLVGWANDIEVLKRIRPGFAAMNPLSASCLILSGIGILLVRNGRRYAALAVGSMVLLVAAAKAADIVWGGIPVDQLLFATKLAEESALPNAMPPNTALAFLLVGLALMCRASGRRIFDLISQGLGASVLVISIFALIGYAFGIHHLQSVGPFIPMALHSGLGLVMVAVGVMSLTPHCGLMLVLRDTGSAGSMARTVLPLAILVPVAVGGLRLWGQKNGYYGTEAGVALQVIANVLVTSVLLTSSIVALYRIERVRRQREQDLTRSEASYRLAEKVAQVGHWRMDLPSQQVTWSEEVFQISGIPKERGVPSAADILQIYSADDRRFVRESVRDALRHGRDWEYLVRICRPSGELRHVSSHGVCERDENGTLTGLFGVFADITELEGARRRAEEATAAKAVFLANMSHEIRTPLNGVMGFAELLLASELDAEQKRHATLIFDSAQTLLKLLNDILDLSKIEAGQLDIAQDPIDLAHQLEQCVRLMDAMAQNKGLALTLAVDPALPKHVVGDGLRVRQILLNLLGNAIKFTASGSVAVEAAAAVSDTGSPTIEINVTDTGVGIPAERQASVFEEFVQADVSTSRRFGGSGLGLTISRRLAALMGGEIKLISREGEGTRVTFTLPLQAITHSLRRASDPPAQVLLPQPGVSATGEAVTILLAEDLDINQELITRMLDRMGYKVDIAGDGQEAIRLASRLREEPDAYGMILMDIQMPVVDGITAARAIRALGGRASQIPIVALTANAYASDIEECRRAGMSDHLPKPVSMAALGAAMTRWLGTEVPTVDRRRPSPENELSLADRFAQRKDEYAARLAELQRALATASDEEREPLMGEAEKIAHQLAGTAAIFGERPLGELAAAVEDSLRAEAENGSARIGDLIGALRRAA